MGRQELQGLGLLRLRFLRLRSNPQPGDIVFTNGFNHVGIYVGNGQMISALNPSQGTQLTAVDGGGMLPVDGYYTVAGL